MPFRQPTPQEDTRLRAALAASLRTLMDKTPALDTQVKVAKACAIAQSTVGRILEQQVAVTLDTVDRLANAFQVPPVMLLIGEDEQALQLVSLLSGLTASDIGAITSFLGTLAGRYSGFATKAEGMLPTQERASVIGGSSQPQSGPVYQYDTRRGPASETLAKLPESRASRRTRRRTE